MPLGLSHQFLPTWVLYPTVDKLGPMGQIQPVHCFFINLYC